MLESVRNASRRRKRFARKLIVDGEERGLCGKVSLFIFYKKVAKGQRPSIIRFGIGETRVGVENMPYFPSHPIMLCSNDHKC